MFVLVGPSGAISIVFNPLARPGPHTYWLFSVKLHVLIEGR